MKKIAITQILLENDSYTERREALDIRWQELLSRLGFFPILLSVNSDIAMIDQIIGLDGIILSGGNSLSCVDDNILSQERDRFEEHVIRYALDRNIPLFGVCRGMQMIAHFFGSTLKVIDEHSAIRHDVFTSSSRYIKSVLSISNVNSFHNYSIDMLSDDFNVVAQSKDMAIEAIEHRKYKIFAQMWHPEREDPFDLYTIKEFFND